MTVAAAISSVLYKNSAGLASSCVCLAQSRFSLRCVKLILICLDFDFSLPASEDLFINATPVPKESLKKMDSWVLFFFFLPERGKKIGGLYLSWLWRILTSFLNTWFQEFSNRSYWVPWVIFQGWALHLSTRFSEASMTPWEVRPGRVVPSFCCTGNYNSRLLSPPPGLWVPPREGLCPSHFRSSSTKFLRRPRTPRLNDQK